MDDEELHQFEGWCPFCGHRVTHVGGLERGVPAPGDGDAVMCIRCGGFAVVAAGAYRRPSEAEAAELAADPAVQEAMALHRRLQAGGHG